MDYRKFTKKVAHADLYWHPVVAFLTNTLFGSNEVLAPLRVYPSSLMDTLDFVSLN